MCKRRMFARKDSESSRCRIGGIQLKVSLMFTECDWICVVFGSRPANNRGPKRSQYTYEIQIRSATD
jgi:hypothetical protein